MLSEATLEDFEIVDDGKTARTTEKEGQEDTESVNTAKMAVKTDGFIDFKVMIKLIMLELKLLIWKSVRSSRPKCTNFMHAVGIIRKSPKMQHPKLHRDQSDPVRTNRRETILMPFIKERKKTDIFNRMHSIQD